MNFDYQGLILILCSGLIGCASFPKNRDGNVEPIDTVSSPVMSLLSDYGFKAADMTTDVVEVSNSTMEPITESRSNLIDPWLGCVIIIVCIGCFALKQFFCFCAKSAILPGKR